jgi:KDO2-lipid IV(A) lauroyltransferase
MFVHLATCAMELLALRWYRGRLDTYVAFATPGHLEEVLARGRGAVAVTGHLGNWELMAQRVGSSGLPNAVIAKATADAKLNALIERFRAGGNVETLWREDPNTGRSIIRTFRKNRLLGILIDQDTRVQGVFVPFFGRPAWTPRAAADFALRFGAPVVVVTTHRRGPRRGDGHVIETAEIPYDPMPTDREAEVVRLTAACSAALEAAIRRHPAEWVWMHERWKRQPDAAAASGEARSVPKTADLSGP